MNTRCESGLAVTNAPGLFSYYFTNAPNWINGATVFQMGSGTYRFNVTKLSVVDFPALRLDPQLLLAKQYLEQLKSHPLSAAPGP